MRRLSRGELRTAAEAASRLLRSPTLFSDSPEIVGFRLPEAYGGATPVAILQVLVFETLANMTKALLREEDPAAESIPLLTLIIKTAEGSGLRSDALRALERDWRVRHYGVSGPVRQSRAEIQKSPVRLRNVITVETRRIVARTTIPDQKAGGSNPSGRTHNPPQSLRLWRIRLIRGKSVATFIRHIRAEKVGENFQVVDDRTLFSSDVVFRGNG